MRHAVSIERPMPSAGRSEAVNLLIGLRYRVNGILHEYLGEALLPDSDTVAHVFFRNEWRPDRSDQLTLTIVEESALEETVTTTRIGRLT